MNNRAENRQKMNTGLSPKLLTSLFRSRTPNRSETGVSEKRKVPAHEESNKDFEEDLPILQQRDHSIASIMEERDKSLGINTNRIDSASGSNRDIDIGLASEEEVVFQEEDHDQANFTAVSTIVHDNEGAPSLEDTIISDTKNRDRREVRAKSGNSRKTIMHSVCSDSDTSNSSTMSSVRTNLERHQEPSMRRSRRSCISSQEFLETLEKLESVKMKVDEFETYFFNHGMSIALGGLFFSLNTIVGAHAAYQFTERGGFTTDDDILRITLPIARVGGRLVTFNCAWLLITGCKHLWTMIRTHVVPILPIGFPIDHIMPKYHRFVALWIIFCGCIIHALPQIFNYASGAIAIDDGSKIWTFGNGMATRQLLITGIMLTFIFTMFFLTTLKAFRKTTAGFRWFWWFHMGGIALAYPLLIVHGTWRGNPIFLICALAPLALYLFDLVKRGSKTKNTKILEWKTHIDEGGKNILELVVKCPPRFVYTPGQYADLKFGMISSSEWHPFTITSAPNNDIRVYNGKKVKVLIFFIQATGRWTTAFFDFASAFVIRGMEISIRGPHGSPSSNFSEYKHIIVIGSGIGVTPLLSVWQYMVGQRSSKEGEDDLLMGSLSKYFSSTNSLSSLMESLSKCFPDSPTRSLCSFDSLPIEAPAQNSKFRLACSKTKGVLESLTVSICLYSCFLAAETIIVVTQIFEHYTEVAIFEIIFASISLICHTGTIIACTVDGGFQYCRLFKCWIELTITLLDALNMCLSISFLKGYQQNGTQDYDQSSTRIIVGLGATSVILHAIRILHAFYSTLKPKSKSEEMPQQSKSKVTSLKGIFINPKYSGMQFCFDQLLQPVEEDLSTNFNLNFYGTRETSSDLEGGRVSSRGISSAVSPYYSFHNGRPDWETVFPEAIREVQKSNPSGGEISIGVFFCGSPAIAKCLRSVIDKVNAQQEFAAKRMSSSGRKYCKCKLVIHVENFH